MAGRPDAGCEASLLALPARNATLLCVEGELWLTRDGDREDYILGAGSSLHLQPARPGHGAGAEIQPPAPDQRLQAFEAGADALPASPSGARSSRATKTWTKLPSAAGWRLGALA
jgi:hypothetical protein